MRKEKTPEEKWRDRIKAIVFPLAFVWWLYTSGYANLEKSIGHIDFLFKTKVWFALPLCVFLGLFTYRTSYNSDEVSVFYFIGVIFAGLFIIVETTASFIDTDKLIVAAIIIGLFVGVLRRSGDNQGDNIYRKLYFDLVEQRRKEDDKSLNEIVDKVIKRSQNNDNQNKDNMP